MRCRLGQKKISRINRIIKMRPNTDFKVTEAFVRGGWMHFWADANTNAGYPIWVNYKTGCWMKQAEEGPSDRVSREQIEEIESWAREQGMELTDG